MNTATDYQRERRLRGTQTTVAALLGVRQATISDRETGAVAVTQEAMIALLSLQKKRKPPREI